METIAKCYPPLDERKAIPGMYLPGTFALTLVPFFSAHRRRTALIVLPFLLSLCLLAPCYTFGNPSADFYRSSGFIIMPIWFIEFAVLRSQEGDTAPVYVGHTAQSDGTIPRRMEDCPNGLSKLRWVVTLMVPSHRGIGWNWQIKNVPSDPNGHLARLAWIKLQTRKAVVSYIGSLLMLTILGFMSAIEEQSQGSPSIELVVDAIIGWTGAIWIYCRLCCFYSTSSVVTVALGIYEIWQLPPLMGDLHNAWSVRQFWATYHQTMRLMVSQPALRITRALGLQKGTIASALSQLFLSFGISCIVHQYQMFNVTRRDMGEFAFFMSQPVAISLEGVGKWLWDRHGTPRSSTARLSTLLGYTWVFLWFSLSLPIYLKGSRDAGIVRDLFFGTTLFDMGGSLARSRG
ncbi:hypothetical protein C7974DRAFT_405197 [Boeremia exigua]|uniref:uncharacterized protein n=1 Tax=Boeremia exigua TaxID=749465 RepID=UPI001E8DE12E|nr:uncharacterized protein C7974DRAFT_405197 [Boeremia exigua]KAH6613127.1 hypothetical protein C7974DRAFT_405197 [Boeremia exigua]